MTAATTFNPPTEAIEIAAAERLHEAAPGPVRDAWRGFRKHRLGLVGMALLIFLLGLALFADFIAPYNLDNQIRDLQWAPPTKLHFSDEHGSSSRPFIYPTRSYIDENFNVRTEEDRMQRCYLRFFPRGEPRSFLGLFTLRTRLFGFDAPKMTAAGGETYYSRFY